MYQIGQRVQVRQWDGKTVSATIEDIGEKNDRTVYDLDNGHWCYEDQITKVLPLKS